MLLYLAKEKNLDTIVVFIRQWAPEMQSFMKLGTYTHVYKLQQAPRGHVIFTDLERHRPSARVMLSRLADELSAHEGVRLVNDPRKVKDRYDIARTLYDEGVNRFNVYSLDEIDRIERYPVFIRHRYQHSGPGTPLIQSRETLDTLLAGFLLNDYAPEELMIVEYLDTSTDGVFAKYGAFHINGKVLPRHRLCGDDWALKQSNIKDEQTAAAEAEFLDKNLYADQVKRAFELAGIDYGRADFSVLDGQIQVWEINTNPVIIMPADSLSEGQMVNARRFRQWIVDEFREMNARVMEGPGCRLSGKLEWRGT